MNGLTKKNGDPYTDEAEKKGFIHRGIWGAVDGPDPQRVGPYRAPIRAPLNSVSKDSASNLRILLLGA